MCSEMLKLYDCQFSLVVAFLCCQLVTAATRNTLYHKIYSVQNRQKCPSIRVCTQNSNIFKKGLNFILDITIMRTKGSGVALAVARIFVLDMGITVGLATMATATPLSKGTFQGTENKGSNKNVTWSSPSISKEHITVFFDHRVRYHTHEADNAYTKQDIAAMINVVSERFNKIIIDTAPKLTKLPPDENSPSRVWIPSIVAEYNKEHSSYGSAADPMQVIVSFEFDADPYVVLEGGDQYYGDDPRAAAQTETSFDVAIHMAHAANSIFPGTVKTLMMTMYRTEKIEYADESQDYSYWQYMQDWAHQDNFERLYVEHIEQTLWPDYELGIFMDVHDCGKYKGELGHNLKNILPYVQTIGLFIDPSTFHHLTTLTPEETQKMFVAKFEDCEGKLRKTKPSLKVMPSTLWKSHHATLSAMVNDWQGMSAWAVQSNKQIIMYEAFDTPGGRDFYYWGHGWWRLKDRTSYLINKTSFVEKIEDKHSMIFNLSPYSSVDEEEDKSSSLVVFSPNCSISPPTSQGAPVTQEYPTASITDHNNHVLYFVLVMLIIILALVVLTQTYFQVIKAEQQQQRVLGRLQRGEKDYHDQSSHHDFVNPGLPPTNNSMMMDEEDDDAVASNHGSVMEIVDTTPIVSVTYKKM